MLLSERWQVYAQTSRIIADISWDELVRDFLTGLVVGLNAT
ncbi:MAG: hypothetical protein VKJ46_13490 [Leptolyngbyaceae bacterium]|nr:hypothetical protein [Leptolyngbyaceae bacterium]